MVSPWKRRLSLGRDNFRVARQLTSGIAQYTFYKADLPLQIVLVECIGNSASYEPVEIDHQLQIRDQQDSVHHSARRISVGSVRSARNTAGSVATKAVSRMAHAGSAIISASVALTW